MTRWLDVAVFVAPIAAATGMWLFVSAVVQSTAVYPRYSVHPTGPCRHSEANCAASTGWQVGKPFGGVAPWGTGHVVDGLYAPFRGRSEDISLHRHANVGDGLYLDVLSNGRKLHLQIDTGVSVLLADSATTTRLGVGLAGVIPLPERYAATLPPAPLHRAFILDALIADRLPIRDVPIVVADLPERRGLRLGVGLFAGARLIVDFAKDQMHVRQSPDDASLEGAGPGTLWSERYAPELEVWGPDGAARARIDTGCDGAVKWPESDPSPPDRVTLGPSGAPTAAVESANVPHVIVCAGALDNHVLVLDVRHRRSWVQEASP